MVRYAIAGVFFGVSALLSCCAPSHPRGSIDLTLNSTFSGKTILIEGTTDLSDGALIEYKLTHEDFEKLDYSLVNTDRQRFLKEFDRTYAEGAVPVSDGKYSAAVDVLDWRPGLVKVEVAFSTVLGTKNKQPAFIIEQFGPMGEYLQGANITSAKGSSTELRWVELSQTAEITRHRK